MLQAAFLEAVQAEKERVLAARQQVQQRQPMTKADSKSAQVLLPAVSNTSNVHYLQARLRRHCFALCFE